MTQSDQKEGNKSSRKLGITMFVLAWLVLFGLLAAFFSDWVSNQNNPNRHPQNQNSGKGQIEVILQPNRQHHYIVNGLIDGSAVTFLLDTGATDVVIPERLANRLSLKPGNRQFANTANGTITVYSTQLEDINIGGIHLRKVRASINPSMNGDVVLLGMSALRQIEFSQRGDTLILRQ